MDANDSKTQRRIKQLYRLLFADQSMMLAIRACDSALDEGRNMTRDEKAVLAAGIAAYYASPFTEGNGLGALPDDFSKFEDDFKRRKHHGLLLLRNTLYAHRDMSAQGTSAVGNPLQIHRIYVEVDLYGNIGISTELLRWNNDTFEEARSLCQFQHERISKKAEKLFEQVANRVEKAPGRYVLGENYP